MIDSVEIKWKPGVKEKLLEAPDKIMYDIARSTLDNTYPTIPELTGKMRRSSLSAGVRGGNAEYYIGSYTDYAKYPYTKDNSKTNWTTPGTNSYWFKEYFMKHGKAIVNSVVERDKLK